MMVPSRAELLGKMSLTAAAEEKETELLTYACYAAYVAYSSTPKIRERLVEMQMDHLFDEIEMPLVYTLFDMEQEGILVESEALKIYGEQLLIRITELEKSIYEQAGEQFNINSPKQLGVILFEKLNCPNGKKNQNRIFHCCRCSGKTGSRFSNCNRHFGIPPAYEVKIYLRGRTCQLYL